MILLWDTCWAVLLIFRILAPNINIWFYVQYGLHFYCKYEETENDLLKCYGLTL